MSPKPLMTPEQFAQMPTAETEDYELVEGRVVPLFRGALVHARIRGRVESLVEHYFEGNPIGEEFGGVDCQINNHTVRRPDVSIFLNQLWSKIDVNEIPVPFAPDIAVEVLCESEIAIDLHRKVLDYLNGGSKEVWLLDEANGELFVQTNSTIRLLRAGDVLETPLLPGFSASVADLLAGFEPVQFPKGDA